MRAWFSRLVVWAGARLAEKSTWTGIALLAACSGRHLSPDVLDALDFWGPLAATGLMAASENTGETK